MRYSSPEDISKKRKFFSGGARIFALKEHRFLPRYREEEGRRTGYRRYKKG
jgi:hypothetical protein